MRLVGKSHAGASLPTQRSPFVGKHISVRTMPTRAHKCKTCPFLDTGWTHVRPLLTERALMDASPICHSTGAEALVPSQGPAQICRGARDVQIQFFYRIGVLAAPTEEAWEAKRREVGI